jgi:hypothetical protein
MAMLVLVVDTSLMNVSISDVSFRDPPSPDPWIR